MWGFAKSVITGGRLRQPLDGAHGGQRANKRPRSRHSAGAAGDAQLATERANAAGGPADVYYVRPCLSDVVLQNTMHALDSRVSRSTFSACFFWATITNDLPPTLHVRPYEPRTTRTLNNNNNNNKQGSLLPLLLLLLLKSTCAPRVRSYRSLLGVPPPMVRAVT